MTKRIFRSICLVAISVFLASVALFTSVLYDYFSLVQQDQLKKQTELASAGVSAEGMSYLEDLDIQNVRITWIDKDGTVLYDNNLSPSKMENHLEREEVKEALDTGYGESFRDLATLLERSLYSAKRLPDGSVLRLSVSQNSLLTLFLGMAQPMCMIFIVAVVLSFVLAYRLSKRIVRPLNELNLDEPLENEGYEELSPLLGRLHNQQRQIKHQSKELARKKEEFETVTGNMTEGIILLNAKGTILSINRAAKRLFSEDSDCVGKHLMEVNRSLEISNLLAEAEKGNRVEKVIELSAGSYQLDISPVVSGGEISGAVLLAMDVTEKEKAEQMRREFTANVSHELKTPLQTISGCAELLSNDIVRKSDVQKFAEQIYIEAQRMIQLVEDIIKLSHLDEGPDDLKWEKVDVYRLASETVQRLSVKAHDAEITLTLDGESTELTGLPQVLQGIIYNLCDNGIKYNRPGGSVTVTVKDEGDAVLLSVADTGIGIPPEHQERIFERFYRVDKSRSKARGGTGLGLSIVKHGVKFHNGTISLRSKLGEGTTVTVFFPKDNKDKILPER